MLPKSQRLDATSLKQVLNEGKVFHSPLITLKALKSLSLSRFSVAVSKKVAASAVDRNKVRRRIYSTLRSFYGRLNGAFNIVIITKPPIASMSFGEMGEFLESFFVKNGFLK